MNDTIGARRRTAWHRLLAGALLALGLHAAQAAEGHCAIQMLELPVKMVGSRAVATVGINGTPVPLVVDTGAFFSMLTDAASAQLKLKLHALPYGFNVQGLVGKVDAQATTVDHLQLLKGDLPDVEFVVGGNELEVGSMGLLGRNILGFTDTEYDFAHGVIRFIAANDDCAKSNMAYWAGATPVSEIELLRDNRQKLPALRTVVEVNGHKLTALFDTGATTSVSLSAAHRAGVKDADMTGGHQLYGAGHSKTRSWIAPFDRVELGGEAVLHNRLSVGDFELADSDMLIGIDFFLSHRIYVSKKRSRMFFTYNGGPVFALNVGAPPAAAASGASAATASAPSLTADELARRGAASLSRGDLVAALADLDRACAMEPDNAAFFATRAQVHAKQADFTATLADLDTALRLDPAQATARMQRGWMRMTRGERQGALDDLAVLDQTVAPQASIRAEMARLYNALGQPTQVISQWTQWIAAHPHDIELEKAWNGRCRARMELDADLDKALDDCDRAVDADAKNPAYLDSRAWVYLRQGNLKKALSDFDRGLALRPEGSVSLYGRGLARLGLGDAPRAQTDLAAARKLDPHIDAKLQKAGLPSAPAAAQ
jgi:tetratricopeptide (TPR) repeat protein/predicted aspartyl protease